MADPVLSNEVLTRRFQTAIGSPVGLLVSATRAMAVDGDAGSHSGSRTFRWTQSGVYSASDSGLDFNAWLDPAQGSEWRFYRAQELDAFKAGYDRLPFYGFAIEPLRLMSLKFSLGADGRPARRVPDVVVIRARLVLADNVDRPSSAAISSSSP